MEFGLAGSIGGKEAIAAANCPQIRLLHVEKVQAAQPAKDIVVAGGAKRRRANRPRPPPPARHGRCARPQNVPGFSAVLYYFGQRLHKDLDVPVGLINSSWGGSPIEALDRLGPKGGGMYNGMIAPAEALRDSRRDLVSGRDQRQQRPEVRRQDEGPDRGLAEGLGLRLPLLLRPDRAVRRLQSELARRSGRPRWPASRSRTPAWR